MYRYKSWATLYKNSYKRIDTFELWYWRRLESPLDCMEIKPLILKEITLNIHWKNGK